MAKSFTAFVKKYRLDSPVYVTQPRMPLLHEYEAVLHQLWRSKWLTNYGVFHRQLEQELSAYLAVKHCSLFCNGTLALLIGMKALKLSGNVITTPFTFPATANVLAWSNLTPIFCDIEATTGNIDAAKIEKLITRKTSAIMPVHVYGHPCNVKAIQGIADQHGLKVIYDAAHAFGVKINGRSLLNYGDMSMVSFHATKIYSTIEGGLLVTKNKTMKRQVDYFKNFGIVDEETVVLPGINAKLNEFQAAFGILTLKKVSQEIAACKRIAQLYRQRLCTPGIEVFHDMPRVKHNYGYFPVLVKKKDFGMSRNDLYVILKQCNIYTRKYFFPLVSRYPIYKGIPSAKPAALPVAEKFSEEILCLPIYGNLSISKVERICDIILSIHSYYRR